MVRRLVGRVAKWLVQVAIAMALLADAPQQLELGIQTSEGLASLGVGTMQAGAHERRPRPGIVTRVATAVVTGVAWLAFVSLPYAEPFPDGEGRL